MTRIVTVDPRSPEPAAIALAVRVVARGGLVAFPTETVYGLAANINDRRAMRRLRAVKGRPRGKPFTVHIASRSSIRAMRCSITKESRILMKAFWPGPLTLILASRSKKIGFRMPDHPVALCLLRRAGVHIVAPSANMSGSPAPTDARGVLRELGGKIDLILDAGPTRLGTESTVVDMTVSPPVILRQGALKRQVITKTLEAHRSDAVRKRGS